MRSVLALRWSRSAKASNFVRKAGSACMGACLLENPRYESGTMATQQAQYSYSSTGAPRMVQPVRWWVRQVNPQTSKRIMKISRIVVATFPARKNPAKSFQSFGDRTFQALVAKNGSE